MKFRGGEVWRRKSARKRMKTSRERNFKVVGSEVHANTHAARMGGCMDPGHAHASYYMACMVSRMAFSLVQASIHAARMAHNHAYAGSKRQHGCCKDPFMGLNSWKHFRKHPNKRYT